MRLNQFEPSPNLGYKFAIPGTTLYLFLPLNYLQMVDLGITIYRLEGT
jgi:hypothetical protein